MSLLTILTDDHPTLREVSKPVAKIDKHIRKLVKDMVQTMRASNGVGLAAPQVGILLRIVVLECQRNPRYPDAPAFPLYAVINPVITPVGKQREEGEEGCLSIPGWYGPVTRYCTVRVTGLNPQGQPVEYVVDGFAARVFQHEVDHLDGILFTDYIDDPTRLRKIDLSP